MEVSMCCGMCCGCDVYSGTAMFMTASGRCSFCRRTLADWSEHYAATRHANIDPWVPDDGYDDETSDAESCDSACVTVGECDSYDFEPMAANRGLVLNGNIHYLFR